MLEQEMITVVLYIPSLRCGGCLKRVVAALQTLPGLEVVSTALPSKTVTLRYARGRCQPEQIADVVRACGHAPTELKEAADRTEEEQRQRAANSER
ncbi:heavy-metal-associated domain-containing protein [Thermogemmatispora sp.]|uniref:heavy-metal-associated domain-containing protein n=1 Tax=Thermogemmatispora sp. TaxID=1968838 RepID=UPI002ACBFB36|nr:heavy-metal-associated domain-containing protein [Thermogemmatispora sp.]